MKNIELKLFLNKQVKKYNTPEFICDDPISIPHLFTSNQDIEIMGLFASIFAWGQRKTIINKSKELIARMDGKPYDFICNHKESDLKVMLDFKHRTFNGTDLLYFISFLQHHYKNHTTLESAFLIQPSDLNVAAALNGFRTYFFSRPFIPLRTYKHIASPAQNSACKRINLFLRWMVRKDDKGVDFGIWQTIKTSQLVCPLDLHSGRVARKLGLLFRPQNDWAAAIELTEGLKKLDPTDPVKYDFALFGSGVNDEI